MTLRIGTRASPQLKTLLLIKPGSFGDIIHALPCAVALKDYFPEARITWLVDERWRSLLVDNPVVHETVTFPRENFRGLAGGLRSVPWALRLSRIRPDVALDLQGLLRSALMARLSRPKRSIGMADAREGARWLYHNVACVRRGEHAVRRYLRALEVLGLPRIDKPVFPFPPGSPLEKPLLDQSFILLHPFARGEGKSLSPEHVVEFCKTLQPLTVVVAGVGTIHDALPNNAVNLLNKTTIGQMISMVRMATFVVSVDSGPMHLAAAINPETLSIHTWSDPRLVGPFSSTAWIWQGGEIRRQDLEAPSLPPAQMPGIGHIVQIANFVKQFVP
ncbi:MAG TPA: glycosyltransferase family 9 protein, partial [Terrimicrobiaceae bacterium]